MFELIMVGMQALTLFGVLYLIYILDPKFKVKADEYIDEHKG